MERFLSPEKERVGKVQQSNYARGKKTELIISFVNTHPHSNSAEGWRFTSGDCQER
jgi:hypothetical protein